MEADSLYYDDAIAIAYLYLKIYGTNKYKNIKQVVIDEAQDYYPLQYEIFNFLFSNAKFTILGYETDSCQKRRYFFLRTNSKNIEQEKIFSYYVG